jgi:hypothetical protein
MIRDMSVFTRPLEGADLDAVAAIDARYATRLGLAPLVDRATVAFYARSGHAFVRDEGEGAVGFVFAHAVWDGGRPVVRLSRVAAADDDAAILAGLLEALVQSPYDAGVYDLVAEVPTQDVAAQAALRGAAFVPRPVVRMERVLGSRAGAGVAG